jgi:glycosyltransferase involved in cell wall biosynthesis
MNLHYLSRSSLPSLTANSVQVIKMCSAFAGLGHRVTLYGRPGSISAESVHAFYDVADDFTIVRTRRLDTRVLGNVAYAVQTCAKALYRSSFSMRNTLFYGRDIYTLMFPALAGIPFGVEVHSFPQTPMLEKILRRLFVSSSFRGLVVISSPLRDYYQKNYGLKNILVSHDGADVPAFRAEGSGSDDGSLLRLVYTGSLYRGRGIPLIIELAERCPEYSFILAGGSPEQIAALSPYPSNIEFRGFLKQRDVQELLASADILLAPYQHSVAVEGNKDDTAAFMSPLKIFEYMAHGKAIIASDLPAIREITGEEQTTCTLCDPEDVSAWESAIRTFAVDPVMRAAKGNAARTLLVKTYSWQRRAHNILAALLHCTL